MQVAPFSSPTAVFVSFGYRRQCCPAYHAVHLPLLGMCPRRLSLTVQYIHTLSKKQSPARCPAGVMHTSASAWDMPVLDSSSSSPCTAAHRHQYRFSPIVRTCCGEELVHVQSPPASLFALAMKKQNNRTMFVQQYCCTLGDPSMHTSK